MCLSCVEGYICDLEDESVEVLNRIAELQAQLKEQEWVKVEDELPNQNDDRVLIFVEGVTSEGFYMPETDEWFYVLSLGIIHSSGRVDNITHWKPIHLPEPKKELYTCKWQVNTKSGVKCGNKECEGYYDLFCNKDCDCAEPKKPSIKE
jgi:hypothetical protein